MNADILYSADFPHGTPAGFTKGCHGAHCPAVIPCRDVYRRYNGDYGFRTRFNAGIPLADILEQEQAEARAAVEAERAARRRSSARAKTKQVDRRAEANRARGGQPLIPRDKLKELLDRGLTDRQIANELGLQRRQVSGTRNNAGFPPNRDQKGRVSIDVLLATVAHMSDEDAAVALNRKPSYVKRRRQIAARNLKASTTSGLSS